MDNLPPGVWQGALIAGVAASVQSLTSGEFNLIGFLSGMIFGALIGMGVAKLARLKR